jgi:peptidoglycan/LPS O-acetylase OafA/YrhL
VKPPDAPASPPALVAREVTGYVPALDGLRAISVLVVMLRHFNTFWYPYNWPEVVYSVAVHLSLPGLDVFFALSGFLISGILMDSKGSPAYYRNFYIRRAIRIFPVYYVFLILWFNVLPLVWPGDTRAFSHPVSTQAWYWTYLTNFMIVIKGGGRIPPNTYHFWSLALEEQFYFIWPTVVYLCSRQTLKRVAMGCVAFSLLFRIAVLLMGLKYEVGFLLLPGHMDPLAAGCLVAILIREPRGRLLLARWARPLWLLTFSVVIGLIYATKGFQPTNRFVVTFGFTASALLAASSVAIAVLLDPGTRLYRVLSHPVMLVIGGYSYAMYILHYPIELLFNLSGVTIASFAFLHSRLAMQLAYSLVLSLATIAAGALSWHGLEKHFLKLKKHFPYGRAG